MKYFDLHALIINCLLPESTLYDRNKVLLHINILYKNLYIYISFPRFFQLPTISGLFMIQLRLRVFLNKL